ncbi:hypothetical protein J6W32_04735 [bacterium]|nr:hypothetical protein [bacterium]MBP5783866.1 hypothetical protein [bacterium]
MQDKKDNEVCFISYGPSFLHLYEKIKTIANLSIVNALFINNYKKQYLD